ncbi:MAG: tetratricopeptide repeat protein [Proteobacteria bacterium]|nr:tetratricopeptide repeat protein [Pseudomonadota bacterium]
MDEYMNEQEQWEFVRNWVRQNALWVVAGVALAAGGLWGWQAWQAHKEAGLLAAGKQYADLVQAFGKNDKATVLALADKLSADHPHTGYADQGQLAAARMQVEGNDLAGALARLQRVSNATSDPELALVVRMRIARLQIEQHQADAALATLAAVEPGAFAGRFAEVRGDALFAKGDRAGALKAYREAQAAEGAQPGGSSGDDLLALKINELTHS